MAINNNQNIQRSPYQEGVAKGLQKAGQEQALEALQSGVPSQFIEKQSGLGQPQLNPNDIQVMLEKLLMQGQQQGQAPVRQPGVFETGGMTQEGQFMQPSALFGLIKPSASNQLALAKANQQETGAGKPMDILKTIIRTQEFGQEERAEERRREMEERRLRDQRIQRTREFGGIVPHAEAEAEILDTFGTTPDALIAEGRGERFIDSEGKPQFRTISKKRFDTLVEKEIIKPDERREFEDRLTLVDEFNQLQTDLAELGITDPSVVSDIFESVEMEQVENPFFADLGPFSIPAKFKLAGQYLKDPKYSAIKVRLERIFQQYRKVVTGAQASDKELRMIRPLFAAFTDRPEVFFAVANDVVAENLRGLNRKLEVMEGIGRSTDKLQAMIDKRAIKNKKTAAPKAQDKQNIDADYEQYKKLIGE